MLVTKYQRAREVFLLPAQAPPYIYCGVIFRGDVHICPFISHFVYMQFFLECCPFVPSFRTYFKQIIYFYRCILNLFQPTKMILVCFCENFKSHCLWFVVEQLHVDIWKGGRKVPPEKLAFSSFTTNLWMRCYKVSNFMPKSMK